MTSPAERDRLVAKMAEGLDKACAERAASDRLVAKLADAIDKAHHERGELLAQLGDALKERADLAAEVVRLEALVAFWRGVADGRTMVAITRLRDRATELRNRANNPDSGVDVRRHFTRAAEELGRIANEFEREDQG